MIDIETQRYRANQELSRKGYYASDETQSDNQGYGANRKSSGRSYYASDEVPSERTTKAVEAKTTSCFSSMEPRLNHLVALVGTPVMACTVVKTMSQSLLRVVTFQDFWQKFPLELPYSLKARSIDFLTHVGNVLLTPLVLLATVISNIAGIIFGNKVFFGMGNCAELYAAAELAAMLGVATCARAAYTAYKNQDLMDKGFGPNDPKVIRMVRLMLAGVSNAKDIFISTSLLNALMVRGAKQFFPEEFQKLQTELQEALKAEAQPKPA